MKKILLFVYCCIAALATNAQAGGYLFSQQLGTYTAINGTVMLRHCDGSATTLDTSLLITLPQAFTFSGVAYTQIRVGKNGWLTFGNVDPLPANDNFYKTSLNNTQGTAGVIQTLYTSAALGYLPDCSPILQTATVGSEYVVQWTNGQYIVSPGDGSGSVYFNNIDVQVRLNFTDNSIKIVYGRFEKYSCSPPYLQQYCIGVTMGVGIRSNGTDDFQHLNSRRVGSGGGGATMPTPIPFTQSQRGSGCYVYDASSIPVGTTFTWTPGSLFPPDVFKASLVEATTATIKWNKVAAADSYEYKIRKLASPPSQFWPEAGTIVTDTTVNLTGLQPDTVYQLAVRSKKGGAVTEWRFFNNTFTTPCNTSPLPYVADFTDAACLKTIRDSATQIGWGGGSLVNEFDYAANPVGSWFFSRRLQLNAGTTYRIYFQYSGNTYGGRTLDNNLKVQMSRGFDDTLNLVSSPALNVPLLYADNQKTGLDTFMLFTPAVTGTYTVAFYARASRALGLVQVTDLEVFDNAVMNTFGCPTLVSPANNSVLPLFNNITLNWAAVSKATKYYYYVSDSAYYGNNTTFDESQTNGLSSLFVYTGGPENNRSDWYVIPRVYGSRLNGCSTNVRTYRFENPAAPVNDLCANAISLPVTNGFCSQPQKGSLIKSTFSNSSDTSGNCMPVHEVPDDVWYKITIPSTGNTIIQLSRFNNYTATNMSMMAFSGSCGALTRIACAFNNRFGPPIDSLSFICRTPITGRTPGETIYIRVSTASFNAPGFGVITDSKSYFTIGAFDATTAVMPAIASNANTCNTMQPTVIDSASGKLYMWVPLLAANGDVIGEVHPAGNSMGTVTGGVYVNNGPLRNSAAVTYLDRNITINPSAFQVKNSFSKAYLRLYARQSEVNAYNTIAGDNGIKSFKINKNTDNCAAGFTNPGNAVLAVSDSARYGGDYVIGTSTNSFSSFYLYKGGIGLPLPLKLISFGASAQNKTTVLNWLTADEVNVDRFEIERSTDGRNFITIASAATLAGTGEKTYRITDNNPAAGINYYRLKIIDQDGKYTHSRIVKIDMGKQYNISIAPNPAHNFFTLTGAEAFTRIVVTDATGKLLKEMVKQPGNRYSLPALTKGIYMLRLINNEEAVTVKLMVE